MDIELKELKQEKVRCEIVLEDGRVIKVFNAIGEKRDELLKDLLRMVEEFDEKEFNEVWYKHIIKNFTNLKNGKIKIRTLLESPTLEFLKLKRSLDKMVNEVYIDMLFAQINNLEQDKISAYTQIIESQATELNNIADEMEMK